MKENTNFDAMLNIMWDLQLPIITVRGLEEEVYGKWGCTNHIIIPSANDEVTDFIFVDARGGDFLVGVTHLKISFKDAIVHFSEQTLRNPGAILKIHSN